jgi:hypothetical protein
MAALSLRLVPAVFALTVSQQRQKRQHALAFNHKDAWTCPLTHPIKGNFTTYSGERCIYHMKGGQFYGKTKPERCYATEDAGCPRRLGTATVATNHCLASRTCGTW